MTLPERPQHGDDGDQQRRRLVFDVLAARSLGRVVGALADAGVPCAPIKGIVLGRWLYDRVWERPYVDVDLLVPRAAFATATATVEAQRWPLFYRSDELGELGVTVDGIPVELHAEVGRIDLSRLTVDDLLARATTDAATFPFPVRRLDDIDHFLLLVLNVIKDGFTYANPHQPGDLERLLGTLAPRQDEIVSRAAAAGLTTALHLTASWMETTHASRAFPHLRRHLPARARPLFQAAMRLHTALDRRRPGRLHHVGGLLGLALATQVPDDPRLRATGLTRVVRRGLLRRTGLDPR